MAVRQIHPHAAENRYRKQRHVRIKIVVAAHADHRKPGICALEFARVVRMIAQMQDGIRRFPFNRIRHAHIVAM